MYTLGIDLGSSSVKATIMRAEDAVIIGNAQYPDTELEIISSRSEYAEQSPEVWWDAILNCIERLKNDYGDEFSQIEFIGIAYQMHGLVAVDRNHNSIRPSIIWCDSRAISYGNQALKKLGSDYCLKCLLNSPGNFTASKLKWLKEHEPHNYDQIFKIMLPGDFISMKLTGKISTTISGLSEGIFWDFKKGKPSDLLLSEMEIDPSFIPTYHPSFFTHGRVKPEIAKLTGINKNAIVSYKAGDQPNNALSLNVLKQGEIAATAGTSGVVYLVTEQLFSDSSQRVNSFAHVNYSVDHPNIGVLLCINGVGIANAWIKRNLGFQDYIQMNRAISELTETSEALYFFPFGNGAERMLENKNPGAGFKGINFNIHSKAHLAKAVQEGVAYAFNYGIEQFKSNSLNIEHIKAGYANMFLSDFFAQILTDLTGAQIDLYNSDGSAGAARGALIGSGMKTEKEVFEKLKSIKQYNPRNNPELNQKYRKWKLILERELIHT